MQIMHFFQFCVLDINFGNVCDDISLRDIFVMFVEHCIDSVLVCYSSDDIFLAQSEFFRVLVPYFCF